VRRVASSLVLLVALAVAGCDADGKSDTGERATPAAGEVLRYPVAYKLPRSVARTLAEGDAWRLIEPEGQVVATSE